MGKRFLAYIPFSSTTVFDYLAICILIYGLIFVYYYFTSVKKPSIHSGNTKLKAFLRKHVPLLEQKYWPAFFYWEGRLQTIYGLSKRLVSTHRVMYQREILVLKDGGEVGLDFLYYPGETYETEIAKSRENSLLVVILPGLTSSSQTSYIKTLALSIVNFGGGTAVVLNNRGLGGVPLKTPKTFCASNCDDVKEVIAHLRQKFPNTKLLALGTSLGGMVLAHYLIDHAEEAKESLSAAVLVSIVWDAWSATHSIETPINLRLINHQLAQNLLQMAKKYKQILEDQECFDYDKILKSKTLRDIDESYTAPQFGYKSVEEYYNHVTVTKDITKFSIPVIALSAYDDPMQPGRDLPIREAESLMSNLALIITKRGGHLGFLEGMLPKMKPVHYMERLVGQIVKSVRLHSDQLDFQKSL